ncbi:hypothetical protein HFO63_32785 [Rhizobium laguerreae]|uniref:hypothetical protein n=1 Tax=Rhizobium laguerreae TaxID=1076926 RepID=UPI001C9105B6|nr:hypothetical protein [Rhizobium laguerreae]MBY3150284.1 hypothetical protein [Rhizobium laguerreae]MBY3424768.1 hypothetical protein [Rhizobium laguerreae]
MKAEALAAMIWELSPTTFRSRREEPALIGDGGWRELPDEAPNIRPIREEIGGIVGELEHVLRRNNWEAGRSNVSPSDAGHWSLGSIEQRARIRQIHRGYLEPIRRFSVLEYVPDLVVAYLARIPGWDDYIKRENHPGVGWHYHYLPDPGRRSDVLLAWDIRWQTPTAHPANRPQQRPLFGEKHGEGKADVQAKPWLWGDKKKESMYRLCAPDLEKWKIQEFRCASNHAEPVWPADAVITPRPVSTTSDMPNGEKKKRHR